MFKKVLNGDGVSGDCVINALSNFYDVGYKKALSLCKSSIPNSNFFIGNPSEGIKLEEMLEVLKIKEALVPLWQPYPRNMKVKDLLRFQKKMLVACSTPTGRVIHDGFIQTTKTYHATVVKNNKMIDRDSKYLDYDVDYVVTIEDPQTTSRSWDRSFALEIVYGR